MTEKQTSRVSTAGRRTVIAVALITIVTLVLAMVVVNANLSTMALVGICAISLLLLAVATLWIVKALPEKADG